MSELSVKLKEIHEELLEACWTGDLNRVFQLSYYHGATFTSLIQGNASKEVKSRVPGFSGYFHQGEYLNLACLANQISIAQHLLKLGASITQLSEHGSPLFIACNLNYLELVKLLVQSGADVAENCSKLRQSGLYAACKKGHFAVVEYLVSVYPSVLGECSDGFSNGTTLLSAACSSGNLELVQWLVEKGVDASGIVPYEEGNGQPPLHMACLMEHFDIINYLIDQKVEIPRDVVFQFPESIWDCLSKHIRKTTRSYSVQVLTMSDYRGTGLAASLEDKRLFSIHGSWFTDIGAQLTSVNLHHNNIGELPQEFFLLLPNMEDCDLSANLLVDLPKSGLSDVKLLRLSANRNQLTSVPLELFLNKSILGIDLSYNKLKSLPPDKVEVDMYGKPVYETNSTVYGDASKWECTSLKELKLNANELVRLPKSIYGTCSLEKLSVANNRLNNFDSWRCPMAELDLSGNELENFGGSLKMAWSKTLSKLILSRNRLRSISWDVCQLEKLSTLDVSYNHIDYLPPVDHWQTRILSKLNLSNNLLLSSHGPEGFTDVSKPVLEEAIKYSGLVVFPSGCDLPVENFKDSLQILDLSCNKLESVPDSICFMTALCELDLSDNLGIKSLPCELGNLRNIWNLRLNNLDIKDLPQEFRGTRHTKDILAYLRARLRKSVRFNRMKLMVVGLQDRGKTTLLATLQGRKVPPNISTVGISVGNWQLQANRIAVGTSSLADKLTFWKSKPSNEQLTGEIVFSTWDLAGQHVYYATHQCFLTSNTLYLVVWNATHGIEGVETLAPWLLNIQARAPQSRVITVGTYIDLIPESAKVEQLGKLEAAILRMYDRKGYPMINGNVFVSNVTGEGLSRLREMIFRVASKMQDSNLQEPMIGKKIPLSYLQMYDRVIKEAARRRDDNEPPILTADEMLDLAKENEDNDITDEDELAQAGRFLHDSGILLHFNDQLRGLSHLFFIDPPWLCDMLAAVVTVPQRNPFISNGCLKKKDVGLIMKDPRMPTYFIPQYLQILERFEIALRLDDEHILIPSMLPKELPDSIFCSLATSHEEGRRRFTLSGSTRRATFSSEKPKFASLDDSGIEPESLCRNYHMRYVPTGFWGRLIARIVTAVHRWGMVLMLDENEDWESDQRPPIQSRGITKTTDYDMTYWREGIMVRYAAGHFLVESFKDSMESEKVIGQGIAITVWSWCRDFSVMGFLTDQIDLLITEWYPGLEDVDEFGMMMIQKLIPCPVCANSYQRELTSQLIDESQVTSGQKSFLRDPDIIYQFPLPLCALAAVNCDSMQCPGHPNNPVALTNLVPDLMLTDMPQHLIVDRSKFEFDPCDNNRLGEGGAGGVYRGLYGGITVAVKQFHSSSATKSSYTVSSSLGSFATGLSRTSGLTCTFLSSATEQGVMDQLEDGKVIRAFWELRQEVAVLSRVQHPCIIGFLGVCHNPLCFVLELAPGGCLRDYLEDALEKRKELLRQSTHPPPPMHSIMGRRLTHSIATQVARALAYLHDSEIIYRDLKSDNILVWSLNEEDIVNVKVSDYGISCFATPQGVIGEGGTPGFQAPEVKTGCAYDEKVDLFSYGIWLYELICGNRPFEEHRSCAEIKRAVQRGIRPSLALTNVDSQLPCVDQLMSDCWVSDPVLRPSAAEVVARLDDTRVYLLVSSLPKVDQTRFESISCVIPLTRGQESPNWGGLGNGAESLQRRIMVWSSQRTQRKFTILAVDSGVIQTDLSCPGPRVLCAEHVEDRIWLGTEGCEIQVFGRFAMQLPKVLWTIKTKDAVTCLLSRFDETQNSLQVYASLANGTLMVFKRIQKDRVKNLPLESIEMKIQQEQEDWAEPTVVNLASRGMVAKSMVLVKEGQELWVSCGNGIVLVDTKTLSILTHIKVFSSLRSLVTGLVTDGSRVWSVDRRSAFVYQWDVATRSRTFKFHCQDENLEGQIIAEPISKTNQPSEYLSPTSRKASPRLQDETVESNQHEKEISSSDEVAENSDLQTLGSDQVSLTQVSVSGKQDGGKITHSDEQVGTANSLLSTNCKESERRGSDQDAEANTHIHRDRFPTVKMQTTVDEPRDTASNSANNSSHSSGINVLTLAPFIAKFGKKKQPSLLFSRKRPVRRKTKTVNEDQQTSQEEPFLTQNRPRSSALSGIANRLTSILFYGNALWLGRASGDVLVVDVQASTSKCKPESQEEAESYAYGLVLTQLQDLISKPSEIHKEVTELLLINDLIIAATRIDIGRKENVSPRPEKVFQIVRPSVSGEFFRLMVYEAWTQEDFIKFKNRKDTLNKMEKE